MADKEQFDRDSETTTLWDDYQDGLAYQSSSGLSKNLPKFVKFYEGDQWASPTKNTKNLPRPVVNIIKMICRAKKSAILATPVKIIYRAEDETADVEKFNNFADYIQKEIGQESLDKKAIDDAVKKGSYFYHYYWDSEAKGKNGIREGGLRCEIIDALNIFFSNPTELDEQKQKWILIASREDVDSVRAKADKGVDIETITSDEADNKYKTIEQEGNKLCTVLTRYFRIDGEVYCEKATRTTVINKPFPLTPDLEAAGEELGFREEDAPNNGLPDNNKDESLIPPTARAYLYPIVVGNYEIRENSIYGLGEVEGIIPNQKAINFNIAMALLNAQEVAWGKYIALPNALKGQVINNEPGQVLIDYSGTGNGIRKMTEQTIQSQPLTIIDTLTSLTRVVTGSTEVMTGETLGASMSGAAIAQLQSQAQQPVEELKDAFWLVKEKQGKVLAQFFKLYYSQKEFSYTQEIPLQGMPPQGAMFQSGQTMEEAQFTDVFDSAEYAGVDFSVVVETTSGTKASAAGDINALDTLLAKGLITLKTYLKAYPSDALSNKTEIIKGVEADEQSQIVQLQQQVQQYEAQIQQLAATIQEQKDTVDKVVSVIEENSQLKAFIANLYSEAQGKIRESNRQVQLGNQKIAETTQDATDFAQVIANQMAGGNTNAMPKVQSGNTNQKG
jgi:predicted regulator of amino acid metabolism with ACT domain